MNDSEKLKALIELAWSNGWPSWRTEGSSWYISDGYTEEDNRLRFEYKSGGYKPTFHLEEVIFGHDFIKALCIAKYTTEGKVDELLLGVDGFWHTSDVWRYHIMRLAVSEDRIGYLYAEFCEA